jgi:putative ABC transport system ATP-binding protein
MTAAVIEAVDIAKVLGTGAARVQALHGVSVSLYGGELALLMGPSGSGKTTLLSILGCILTPTTGTVRVLGRSTKGARAEILAKLRREHIGFVFQTYHLFPTLNATDNVRLALEVRDNRPRGTAGRAKEALDRVGLSHKARAYPRELSSGEQQRVAIARAIVGNASIILADEPTAALDTENGRAIMKILNAVARDDSRGVLVVTHDPRLEAYSDRIIHIEDGRIVREEQGTARGY